MNIAPKHTVLIVEPNPRLGTPYVYLPNHYTLTCVSTIARAQNELKKERPDMVMLSMSFPPEETVNFLEDLRQQSSVHIVPLVFVIDLSVPISQVLGTTWAERFAILHSLSQQDEVVTVLNRMLG